MWVQQIIQWGQSAISSGMATIGLIGTGGLWAGVQAWLSSRRTTAETTLIKSDVAIIKDSEKSINEKLDLINAKVDKMTKGLEGCFLAINILGQNSSINVNAKSELANLSANVLPQLKSAAEIQSELSAIAVKVQSPITDVQKQLEEQKAQLQAQATAQLDNAKKQATELTNSYFDKFKQGAISVLDTAKDTIIGDKQA